LAVGALVLLGPLIFDQLVFFGDQEQTARAVRARALMPIPAAMLLVGATIVGRRRGLVIGIAVASPLASVGLALAMPEAAYQLLAYGLTLPIAVGATAAGVLPLPERLPVILIGAGVAVLGVLALVGTAFIALLVGLAAAAWWRLSVRSRRPDSASV
jgi:hypothetical protein